MWLQVKLCCDVSIRQHGSRPTEPGEVQLSCSRGSLPEVLDDQDSFRPPLSRDVDRTELVLGDEKGRREQLKPDWECKLFATSYAE